MSAMTRLFIVVLLVVGSTKDVFTETPEEWEAIAAAELDEALNVRLITTKPKNVLFFLGDGMGISTLTAGRIYKGQLHGQRGEEGSLCFEKFPHLGLSKTYNDDFTTPDSAGTATAYFCGQKAKMGVIGVSRNADFGDCKSSRGTHIPSILEWAQDAGKATGLITTTRITHATPAATYAHSPHRDWEADYGVPKEDRTECEDIASQLITGKVGRNLKVIFGGGREMFMPKNGITENGKREDGRNLFEEWRRDKQTRGFSGRAHLVNNRDETAALDADTTEFAFGLFGASHMEYEFRRNKTAPNQPALKEMVRKAIQILQKDPNGFHLVVEGGRIDHAHHDGIAKMALHELVSFDEAIEVAISMVPEDESLLVVTADHSHTLSLAGYPRRGNPILKFAAETAADGLQYTSLSYANGPGALTSLPRRDLTQHDTERDTFLQDALIPTKIESHGGEDVAIYAKGPWAHLFHGLHEQHYIPHAIDYAACYRKRTAPHCRRAASAIEARIGTESAGSRKYSFLNNHHL